MIYTYNQFLEKKINKISLDEIYKKYYSEIERNIFEKIVSSDPTSTIDGTLYMGKYSKWLLKLFKTEKLKLEDLYKAKEYLELFDKQSVRNKLNRKDINQYKNLSDLAKSVIVFEDDEEILSKIEKKDKNFVKEFEKFNLYIPRTFKDSCILGKGTEWCTATENTSRYYNQYHKPERELLIFISKDDPKEKYQFHFRSKQFMDKFDSQINIKEFLNENPDINDWLKNNVKDYKKINSNNDIRWKKNTLKGAPKKVEGYFDCNSNKLTTLKGAPEIVEGNFDCSYNNLTTLEGAPEIVEGYFDCNSNNLTTLEGAPEKVEGYFYCSYNKLTTLEGAPEKVEGSFYCNNNKLTTLEGAPKIVEGNFSCSSNNLTSLEGAPEKVEDSFNCSYNNLTSLEGAPKKIEGNFYCRNNNLTEADIEWLKQNCEIKGKIYG